MPLNILPMTTLEDGIAAFKQHVEERLHASSATRSDVMHETTTTREQMHPELQQLQEELRAQLAECTRKVDAMLAKLDGLAAVQELQRQQISMVSDAATRVCADTSALCDHAIAKAKTETLESVTHSVRQMEELVQASLRDAVDNINAQHAATAQLQKTLTFTPAALLSSSTSDARAEAKIDIRFDVKTYEVKDDDTVGDGDIIGDDCSMPELSAMMEAVMPSVTADNNNNNNNKPATNAETDAVIEPASEPVIDVAEPVKPNDTEAVIEGTEDITTVRRPTKRRTAKSLDDAV